MTKYEKILEAKNLITRKENEILDTVFYHECQGINTALSLLTEEDDKIAFLTVILSGTFEDNLTNVQFLMPATSLCLENWEYCASFLKEHDSISREDLIIEVQEAI